MVASPQLLWKRNSGNGIGGFFTASEQNKRKHLSEHKRNVLGMQKQPTMQTEKIFNKLQASNYSNFSLKERLQHLRSLDSHTIKAERGLLFQERRPACLTERGFQWLFLVSMYVACSLVCESQSSGRMFHVFNSAFSIVLCNDTTNGVNASSYSSD